MKKLFTSSLLLCAGLSLFAQIHRAHIPEEVFDNTRTRTYHFSFDEPGND